MEESTRGKGDPSETNMSGTGSPYCGWGEGITVAFRGKQVESRETRERPREDERKGEEGRVRARKSSEDKTCNWDGRKGGEGVQAVGGIQARARSLQPVTKAHLSGETCNGLRATGLRATG